MNDKTQARYQTIILYEQGLLNSKTAAASLEIGERQFFRILKNFQASGRKADSLEYQSHPAWNRSSENMEAKILKLNKDYPQALNSHLSWLAWDLHELSVNPATARNILIRNGKYVPFQEKRDKAYKRFSATHFGALAQIDASDGYWLNGYPMIHLILILDDASRTILAGGFFNHDSTLNNMLLMKELIRNYGVPALFYADNDSKFKVIRHGKSRFQTYRKEVLDGQAVTEIRRALAEAGSGLITHAPFHPQGKGKIEKIIKFIQQCFLKNHRAKNLEELNRDFKRWVAWYDNKNHRGLGLAPRIARENLIQQGKNAFRSLDENMNLDTIFSIKEERKPNKYNIFSYEGREYQLPLEKVIYPGRVELRIMPDNGIRVFNKEKELIAELEE